MRAAILGTLAVGLLLAGCAESNPNAPVNVQAVDLAGKAGRCIPASNMGVYVSSEVTGDLRARLLTPEALAAGVRVFRKDSDVTNFGQQTLQYTNAQANCVLWMEGLTLQEYAQRLGLSPIGVSPFYQPDEPKPVATPTPTPTPTPTETPAPVATPTPEASSPADLPIVGQSGRKAG
jgi:hypothetical protein